MCECVGMLLMDKVETHQISQGVLEGRWKRYRSLPYCWKLSWMLLAVLLFLVRYAQGQGPGVQITGLSTRSKEIDMRVQFELSEGQPPGTIVGTIPTKPNFIYRFNDNPPEFHLNATTGLITTTIELDRESLPTDRFDLVVLSSQPTYPIEVRIIILDINDNAPTFPEPSIEVSFSESANVGTRVILDTATDGDAGVNDITTDYKLVSGNEDGKFRLVVTTNPSGETPYLHLETMGRLDREVRSFYQLNISAQDGGVPVKIGYLQVNITILDVNDNPPIFDHSDYSVSLNESVPPGTSVLQVRATDNDLGDNSKITYFLSDTETQFSVDPQTGIISTVDHLNCQQNCPLPDNCPKSCVFTVFARDHGSPRQDGRAYVTVNLLDANDHDPIIRFRFFPSTANYATVDENAQNGSVVAAVSVIDFDEGLNGETAVDIQGGNEYSHFRLESTPSFDIVRVNAVLDREQISKYNLTITATDKGSPPRSSTAFLIIHVNDVNDHEPVFEKSEYSTVLSELVPLGTYVAAITATDEDTGINSNIYYSIVSGNDKRWFSMDIQSGLITTVRYLNREDQDFVELKISARDGGPSPRWAYTYLKIQILDENDEAPAFSQSYINVSLSEHAPPNSLITIVSAVDNDLGTNGSVIYSLDPKVDQIYHGKFSLDPTYGRLMAKVQLDREEQSVYFIKVIAKDQGQPPLSSTTTVQLNILDVNDNTPSFYPKLYFISVKHNIAPGTSLSRVTAFDRDDGRNAVIVYSLVKGDSKLFDLAEKTGVISVKKKLQMFTKYELVISAQNSGDREASDSAKVVIYSTDATSENNKIEFQQKDGYSFTVEEDYYDREPSIGREIGRVSTTSSGSKYVIIDGDDLGWFKIDERMGIITTAQGLDREKKSNVTLKVIAYDTTNFVTTFVNVIIRDVNDYPPTFLSPVRQVEVMEDWPVGREVYLLEAVDLDEGTNCKVEYSLSSNPQSFFAVDKITGMMSLNRPLRYEAGNRYTVEVIARDSGIPSLSNKIHVTVVVNDVNDHAPIFDHMAYEISLLESTPINERFYALHASDSDSGNNGQVTYDITEGNVESKFGIFPDGYLYVRSFLDREKRDYYALTVTATDNGTKPRTSSSSVIIHIIDENDNSPTFSNETFVFYVPENEPPDTYVGKLSAEDDDKGRNAELTYSISTNQHDFLVDPKSGFVRTQHYFDREKQVEISGHDYIIMEAVVMDGGITRLRDEAKVTVYVTDVNDNAPQFIRTPYRAAVSEGAPVRTMIVRVSATDADDGLNGNVVYSILEGDTDDHFLIDQDTGQITLVKSLDRESVARYVLTVIARDSGEIQILSSTATVTIDVLDENDNSPKFTVTTHEIEIQEDAPINHKIFNFTATDADLGLNGEISFSIVAGNIKETFKIDSNSGILYLSRPLDYEEQDLYHLNVTASDGGAPRLASTLQFIVKILDVNDNSPTFSNVALVRQIEEGIAINTPILTVIAEDKDSGDNGKVVYDLVNQEPAGNHFAIKRTTGVITTTQLIDREYSDAFRLRVIAHDLGSPKQLSAEKTVTIIVEDVNDNAPTFVSMDTGVLPENSERGYVVMTLSAVDADANMNGMVNYELIDGNYDLFFLDRTSGDVYLSRKIDQPDVIYTLTVQATDQAPGVYRKTSRSKITVVGTTNRPTGPVFSSPEYFGSVFENERVGTSILGVRAQYKSGSGAVSYYLTGIYSENVPQKRMFAINRQSGVITTAAVLDRESGAHSYELIVYAVDTSASSPHTTKTKVTVTVLDRNDSPPVFRSGVYIISLSEDAPPGHTITIVSTTDEDTEGNISYSLAENKDNNMFQLDPQTGTLLLREPLDREVKPIHKLVVGANDGVQMSQTTVTIEVIDTNDNPPVFEQFAYSFDIPEDVQRGAQIGTVIATDADIGINGQVSYSVLSDWGNDVFSLNPQTGIFTLTSHLDYEQVQHYIFVVQAQDSGQPSLSTTVTVYFNVLDLNDNAPLFDPMSYSDEIFENVTIGTSVIQVTATDLDSGENGKIFFNIVEGDDLQQFAVMANGTIVTTKPLDREIQSFYSLILSATDQSMPEERRLSSTVQVTIILKDVNDLSPEFVTPNKTSILENVPINTVIMAIKAVDKDEGRNSYIEYSLAPHSDRKFNLSPVDGLLRVNSSLDREVKSQYEVTVIAKDRGHPPRSASINILIDILDENDNSPAFDPKQYSASVSENASVGLSVLQVSATDRDDGLNGQVRYSVIAGDANHDFQLGEDTGIIHVSKNLDYERKNHYLLIVQAEDNGNDVRYDTATVTIIVTDINDNPPTFLDSPYEIHILENAQSLPTSVVTLSAYDADLLPNNRLHYLIKDGDKSLFHINSTNGEITVQKSLDREKQSEYILTILAVDSGSPRQTGTGTVTVVVNDVNDNKPFFEKEKYVVSIKENLPTNSPVITITAIDADTGRNGLIRYSLRGKHYNTFLVDPFTGTILTRLVLDREERDVYSVLLVAQDSGMTIEHSASVEVTILVGDENDNQPHFAENSYVVYIPETSAGGHFVFGAHAEDLDVGLNSRLVYHLSGTDADKFQINQDTGVLKLVQKLTNKSEGYHLEIHATDSSTNPLSSSINVEVHLRPAHLFPYFHPGVRNFVFQETAKDTQLTVVQASSRKTGDSGKLTYHIGGGNVGNVFTVNSHTGEVRIIDGLDYEVLPKYELWIEARDSDIPPLSSVVRLDIDVTDANDNAPIFTVDIYNATIREEQNPPQFVIAVKAHDNDKGENSEIIYKLIKSTDSSNPFTLDAKTGKIYTSLILDREQMELYRLIVQATDRGNPSKTGTATVLVTVLDKNDNPPRFTRLFSVNVTENAPLGTFVIQVTSSDKDIDLNANATYSFTENPGGKFYIDPVSGNVTIAGWLDRELKDEYLLKVAAVDGSWRAETPLTISIQDVNDNSPKFSSTTYVFNVAELQRAVSFVGQVTATDQDKQGPNSMISYCLKRPSDLFRIDPVSGEIMSKQTLHYKHSLRYVSPENQHILRVVATDHGQPPMSSEVNAIINIVDSNNNAPVFEKSFYFSPVSQNSGIGLSVIQLVAKDDGDIGINAEIEYKVIGGNGTNYFNIHKMTGWITVSNPLLGQKGQWYNLQISAMDKGVPPKSSKVDVQLVVTGENQHNPVFTALSYQVIIPENEPLHSEIVAVMATDDDSGLNGEIIYSIIAGNKNESFHIGESTGSVTIIKPLDYETIKEYHLNLTATDRSFKQKHATAILTVIVTDINDNPPLFSSSIYDVHIAENEPPGTSITQLTAIDVDSSRNAVIQYSIVGGSSRDMFSINIHTGVIFSKVTFDYEENNLYILEVIASNPGSNQFSSVKVNIHVTSKNEFYPHFIQPVFQFTVCESAGINTAVGTLQATDDDTGPDGEVFYLLVGSSNDRGFRIEPETGIITVARRLDRESQARVVLTVMAKNLGSIRGNDTDEAQVVISIEDGNDPPLFSKQTYEVHASESSSLGTSVIIVSAIDKDVHPNNNHFSYSVIDGNIGKAFIVDSQSGLVQTAAILDRETISVYNLTVAAIDTGTPPQTGTALIKIFIDDVNDNGPVFDPPDVLGYVMENEPAYTSVMVLSAVDPDLPPNGAPFMYFLVGGEYKEYFEIDRHTGLVKTTQQIDREASPTIQLVVEVHDSGIPQMKSRHTITIVVMDKNDSPSSPRALTVFVWIFNSMFPGGKIAHIHPFDPDMTGQYMCNLLEGDASVFRIPTKCDLHAVRLLNPNNYTLTVSGNDGRHPDVTSTIRVQFMAFDNKTVQNSITLKILNHSADDFLTQQFERFQKAIGEVFKPSGLPVIYSITTLNNHLEMTLAVKMIDQTYFPAQDVLNTLNKKNSFLRGVVNQDEIIFGYNPCQNSPCENDGKCQSYLDLQESLSIVDSPSLVFTSPTVSRQYSCTCTQGFSGPHCQYQEDPCAPNPCLSGGMCHHDGYDFQCLCPPQYQGKHCESVRTDLCASFPCKNGGSCEEASNGSFFCLCRPGFRGTLCEQITDSCRPNRCLNGGTCITDKPGYRCLCETSFFGRHCEKSSYGFHPYSYMAFPSLNPSTNDISIIFSTNKQNSLLVYNYGIQTGGRSDFLALEIVNGRASFSFGGARTAIATVTTTKFIADGKWYKIAVIRNGRIASISVADCNNNGETCEECFHGNTSCSMSTIGHTGTLNFHANLFYLGGVPSVEPIVERPGQITTDDFVGCIHSVAINGRMLDLNSPIKSVQTTPTCNRKSEPCTNTVLCGESGYCKDIWFTSSCVCSSGVSAPNCNDALEPFFLSSSEASIELLPQEKHRRLQVFANSYHRNEKWKYEVSPMDETNTKSLSFMIRTKSQNGVLLYAATEDDYTALQLQDGKLLYISEMESKYKITEVIDGPNIANGNWHTIILERGLRQHSPVNISIDSNWKEIDSEMVHDFLDAYLTSFTLGGQSKHMAKGFQGCIKKIVVNEEIQALNNTNGYFKLIPHGNVHRRCGDEVLGLDIVPTDPLSIGIILVIVFFIILIVVILVSFLVFRRRKMRREKTPGHVKHNGNAFLTISNNDNQRTHQDNNYVETTSAEDILRNHLSQDLVPKKMKDREITDINRPQRPDIIEREVLNKSSSSPTHRIEDPPLQENSKPFTMLNIADSEPPEHYDLENASSIAPSDIDIVYHYKGFRDGNVHKYKTNPHIPNYHKHNHRHSPHQFQSTPSRDSPRNILCQSPNAIAPRESPSVLKMQNTPLARLSPSSELSQQTPRILTLQDISGKPLQTALLATSQGVGPKEFKDPLTNSERSLNSPVSHLSHSTSSIHSGPQSNSKKKNGDTNMTLGLTAEEIERLNARPRNSSLVSTLDAVSSSSDDNPEKNKLAELLETNTELLEAPDSSTDESGNDSFTCSEFEYDNYDKVQRDFGPGNMIFSKLAEEDNENDEDSAKTYDGFDSFRGSLSTLVASDDDLSNLSSYKPANGSMLGWDYLLNWGPNFQNLVGVFKDIAELPDTVNGNGGVGHSKPSEEYV